MSYQTMKRIVSGIVTLALFSLPLILSSNAFAANNSGNSNSGLNWSSPNSKNPFKIDASTLLNANNLMAVVGCTGIIDTVTDAALKLATKVVSNLLGIKQSVPVADTASNKELKKANKITQCYNGLAYALARQQLVSMTKSTMNWVNSGFSGDPLYVKNITSLTNNIEGKVLEGELKLFENPAYSRGLPYGKTFAQSQIRAYKSLNSAGDSLKEDLTSYLSDSATVESFAKNFSEGGWGGWLALTQKSNNNPIGYGIESSQKIADKQQAEVTATKAEVTQNGGFLDQKKCVLWNMVDDVTGNYITEDVYDGENGWSTKIKTTTNSTLPEDVCIKYAAVTPGSLIKDKVSKYLNSPETQLELADSLNEVLYSIFGNLISRLQQTGLASLASNTEDFSGVSSGLGANKIIDANGNDVTSKDQGSGFDINDSFDITKDLGDIIKTQQEYITTVGKLFDPLSNVMTDLGKLDYCIPGPNPSWQTNSSNTKDAYTNYLNNITVVGDDRIYKVVTPSTIDTSVTTAQTTAFKNYIENINNTLTNFWSTLQTSWYFTSPDFGIKYKENASETDLVSRIVEARTSQVDATEAEYKKETDNLYGFNSPMQTEYLNVGTDSMTENPAYLPMAQAGLNITKDIYTYDQSIGELVTSYQARILDTRSNIYKLTKISDAVNKIVAAAQKRRADARALAGEPAITAACLANERTVITQ